MHWGIRVIFVVVSAGLGVLVFPSVGWWWLAPVAWIPLFVALRGAKPSHGFYLGLLHGVVFYGLTLSWLVHIFRSMLLVAPLVMVLALFTALFSRGYAVASRRIGGAWRLAMFAAVWWVALEFIRSEIFYLKFPWMTPGVGLGPTWVSPLIGVYGMSFILIGGAALVIEKGRYRLAGIAILLVMLVSGFWKIEVPLSNPVKVMAVQSEATYMDRYAELTLASGYDADLIVWPEYGIPRDVRKNQRDWKALKNFAEKRNAVMVVGTQTVIDEERWHNTALTLDGNGTLGEHYKNHTVHFFQDGVAGTETKAIDTPVGKIGTPICFDCDYEDVIRRMVRDGAELLAIPSMDAESWSRREHFQHAELFRHRAAENGRWMVVSATSGVTQIIDPHGKRVHELPLIEEGVLTGEIGRSGRLTLYTRIGWLFPWMMLVAGVVWVLVLFVQGFNKKS